jgi:hypothetical protein
MISELVLDNCPIRKQSLKRNTVATCNYTTVGLHICWVRVWAVVWTWWHEENPDPARN